MFLTARKLSLPLMVLLSSACEPQKTKDKPQGSVAQGGTADALAFDAGNFTPPPGLESFDQLQIVEAIHDRASEFMANDPADQASEGEDSGSDCATKAMEGVVLQASDTKITIDTVVDLGPCMREIFQKEEFTIDSLSFKSAIKMHFECSGGGLAPYNGKNLGALDGSIITCSNGTQQHLMQSVSAFQYKLSAPTMTGEKLSLEMEQKIEYFEGMPNATNCISEVKSGLISVKDGCTRAERTVISKYIRNGETKLSEMPSRYFKMQQFGVSFKEDGLTPWPESGSAKVELADWQGVVTFKGGSIAPSYELKKGSQTVKGDFSMDFSPLSEESGTLSLRQASSSELFELAGLRKHLQALQAQPRLLLKGPHTK